ncbi:uncharacterized protein CLAFUR5_10683 [Fulvia fulva]|uniref:Uncharacterized protein n=1 Tax=Passalora fulva TaxID=5499 RepID=A0A9Q8URV3_PASFU|nr:uncharacterized protein CLAFUR5_10683 [Fulvia fulva]KAK4620580.1 hypothetical protein CLAFUR0_11652 [Fulvia fulva]UJO20125.1 hypothetical protein CLAFUR5_10683 [Fulvia fulva]WPV32677.1 hypothetical protein CLAFUW7_11642 [Fulvia fulva]
MVTPDADSFRCISKAIKDFLEVPWPQGRKNTSWFLKATECRSRLASLWEAMRQEIDRNEQVAGHPSPDRLLAKIQFDSAPSHIVRVEQERQECELRTAADAAAATARRTADPGTVTALSSDRDEVRPVRRKLTKAKAARLAHNLSDKTNELAIGAATTENSPTPSLPPIPVKHETLGLFNKMFPDGDAETKSDVRWDVFVQAMADAGFVATDASGSAVNFSSDGQGRIVFHRPHPDPVIDLVMLHTMGRRLSKSFGWCAGRFVLRGKNEITTVTAVTAKSCIMDNQAGPVEHLSIKALRNSKLIEYVDGLGTHLEPDQRIVCAPPLDFHEHCDICSSHYRPLEWQSDTTRAYAGILSDDTARALIEAHLADVESSRNHLQGMLQSYGDIISRRWEKKSQDYRKQKVRHALSSAFAESSSTTIISDYSDDLDAFRGTRWASLWRSSARGDRWPLMEWLNIGDFCKDKTMLLSLLHVRTAHHNSSWIVNDTRATAQTFRYSRFPTLFNGRTVKMCGDDIGELLNDWDQNLMHSFARMGFPRALMTLQTQQRLMVVLCLLVDSLVDGAIANGNTRWQVLVNNGLHPASQDGPWSSYTNPTFAAPLLFDPERMLREAVARREHVLDELWLMQTDPPYMHLVVSSRKKHFKSLKQDVSNEALWSRVALTMTAELCSRVTEWAEVIHGLEKVNETFQSGNITIGAAVESTVEQALYNLGDILHARLGSQTRTFYSMLPSSAQLRASFWFFEANGVLRHRARIAPPSTQKGTKLLELVELLNNAMKDTTAVRARPVFRLLEHELQQQNMLDARLYEQLSDMILTAELFVARRWSQHGQPAPRISIVTDEPGQESGERQRQQSAGGEFHTTGLVGFCPQAKRRLSSAFKGFHATPWPRGTRDLIWLQKAEKCRVRLRELWDVVREETIEVWQGLGPFDLVEAITAAFSFDKEMRHLESLEVERQKCKATNDERKAAAATAATTDQGPIQWNWGSSEGIRPKQRKQTKARVVRNSVADLSDGLDNPNLDGAIEGAHEKPTKSLPVIYVKQETLNMFNRMYAHDDAPTKAKNVRWSTFVQAMAEAGLLAADASGSAVSFESVDGGGRIVFHKPHPDSTIDPIMLRAMGKRLRKWFGWDANRFALRDK